MENYKNLQVDEIGNKAFNLNKLEQSSFNVPKWCVLPYSFLKQFNEDDNQNKFEMFMEKEFSTVDSFSVRTSSSVEDSNDYSFAGQFDTYLNIHKEELKQTIQNIMKDLINKNLDVFIKDENSCSIGIIIQEMILPQKSGVLFTANPQGLLNETVIVVGNGVGENVVEDKENTTTYYYNLTDNLYYYSRQNAAAILTLEEIDTLISESKKIKELYQVDVDIEWCIKDNQLYILQVRPITTLKTDNVIVLDNSNIVESYPNITLPLTQSYVKEAYYRTFYKCFERICGENIAQKHKYNLENMVDTANGRMYYQINNWYIMMQVLPFSKKIIPIWQEMLGVNNKSVSTNNVNKNNIYTLKQVIKYFSNNNENMNKLNEEFKQIIKFYEEKYNDNLNNEDLIGLFEILINRLSQNWDITLINDMYAFIYTYLLEQKVQKIDSLNYKIITNKLITQNANIDSMEPLNNLLKISEDVRKNPELLEELRLLKNDKDFYKYIDNNKEFANEINKYIEKYGDRALEELKFESKTFRSSPILLIKEIINYAENNISLKLNTNRIDEKIKITPRMKKLITKAGDGIRNRENSRLNRSRIFGMMRNIFNKIGENLYELKEIENPEDIFYLEYPEIIRYIRENNVDIKQIILNRKEEYKNYKSLPAYSRLVFDGVVFNKSPINVEVNVNLKNQNKLQGVPAAGEEIIGEVIVVDDPKKVNDSKDKILVTKMTDPGWVFLLATAKGVISEKGSILSHTAIISRELSITAVVGVKNATKILKTGDIVKVNGKTGEIDVIERK